MPFWKELLEQAVVASRVPALRWAVLCSVVIVLLYKKWKLTMFEKRLKEGKELLDHILAPSRSRDGVAPQAYHCGDHFPVINTSHPLFAIVKSIQEKGASETKHPLRFSSEEEVENAFQEVLYRLFNMKSHLHAELRKVTSGLLRENRFLMARPNVTIHLKSGKYVSGDEEEQKGSPSPVQVASKHEFVSGRIPPDGDDIVLGEAFPTFQPHTHRSPSGLGGTIIRQQVIVRHGMCHTVSQADSLLKLCRKLMTQAEKLPSSQAPQAPHFVLNINLMGWNETERIGLHERNMETVALRDKEAGSALPVYSLNFPVRPMDEKTYPSYFKHWPVSFLGKKGWVSWLQAIKEKNRDHRNQALLAILSPIFDSKQGSDAVHEWRTLLGQHKDTEFVSSLIGVTTERVRDLKDTEERKRLVRISEVIGALVHFSRKGSRAGSPEIPSHCHAPSNEEDSNSANKPKQWSPCPAWYVSCFQF